MDVLVSEYESVFPEDLAVKVACRKQYNYGALYNRDQNSYPAQLLSL